MKKKIVLWGHDENDKKILLALALQEHENKVHIYTFAEDKVSEEFYNNMMDKWRSGAEVEFPEGYETIIRELSMTDDILPETIKVQRTDLITRAKSEWHFVVLSTKLYDLYSTELEDFKAKIASLMDFDNDVWDEIRGFWSKITEQSRERNLFREHANKLRDDTNELFVKMKELKSAANEKLAGVSKEHVTTFSARLTEVKEKAEKGMSLGPLFDQLKKIQNEFKNAEFTRNDRSKVWKRIDEAFKLVKEKKYGKQPEGQQGGAVSRLERRYQGLKSAIGKMKASIKRDQSDIDFHNSRNNKPSGQLEMQLRDAKIQMIKGRMDSKQEKLDEMLSTQTQLDAKMEKEKARELKQAEKKAIEKKKAELKKQIDATVSDQAELSPEEAKKLELAAASLNRKKKAPKEETKDSSVVENVGKGGLVAGAVALGANMMEKAETGAEDLAEKVEDAKAAAGELKDAAAHKIADAKETVAETKEKVTHELEEEAADMKAAVVAAKQKGEDAVDATKAKLAEKAEDAKAAAGELKDEAAHKIADAKETVAETKEKVAHELEEEAADMKAAVVAAKQKGEDAVDATKAKLAEKAEDAKAAAGELKDEAAHKIADAKETVAETKEKVTHKLEEEAADMKAAVVAAKQKGEDAVDATKAKLAEKAEDAKAAAGELKDEAAHKLADAKEKVAGTEEKVAHELEEEAAEAKDAGKENKMGETLAKGGLLGAAVAFGSKLADSISDKVEEVADNMGMGDAFDSAKEKMDDFKEQASEKIDDFKDQASEKLESAKDSVSDIKDKVADKAGDAKDEVNAKVEEAKAEAATKNIADDAKENKMGGTLAKGGLLGAAVALGSKLAGSISDKVEDVADNIGMGDAFDSAKEKLEKMKDGATESVTSVADRVRAEGKDVLPDSVKGMGEEE